MARDSTPDGGMSLGEIARRLGCSQQAVHQVLHRGMRKARAACEARGIDPRAFFDAMTRDGHRCRVDSGGYGGR